MSDSVHHISEAEFAGSFAHLVEGRRLLPKRRGELDVLLVSVVCQMPTDRQHTEVEVDRCLRRWLADYGAELATDHVTLRRYLVDWGFLERDLAGTQYRVTDRGYEVTYDASIRAVDLDRLLAEARSERAARKQRYLDSQ